MRRMHSSHVVPFAALALFVAGCGSAGESKQASARPSATNDPSSSATPASASSSDDAGAPAAASDPNAASPNEYAAEKAWAEAHGVTIEAGKVTVVAKRRGSDKRSDVYEDMFVVFRADGTLTRYIGTTKPAQMPSPSSAVVPDVNGDGRKDLGIVRPGIYVAHGDVTYGMPGFERSAFKVTTEDDDSLLPAWRDLDADGIFSDTEKTTAEQRNYRISGIYIHYGFAPTGTKLGPDEYIGPWSVGCQNIQYDQLDAFIKDVGGASATFRYAIVAVP